MYLLGYVDWSLFASNYFDGFGAQIADANVSLVFPVTQFLQFTADYTLHGPGALAALQLHPLGLQRQLPPVRRRLGARRASSSSRSTCPLDFEVGYRQHPRPLDGQQATDASGEPALPARHLAPHQERHRGRWRAPASSCPTQGYWQARAFGSMKAYGFTGTLDFQGYWFDQPVNAVTTSMIGSATLGYDVGGGFAVVGALQGGATPYYTSYVNGLVKLTYNATYRSREVYE